ncbi:hypothetical protein MRX96_050097, partial [Rhipicephalus microplus]
MTHARAMSRVVSGDKARQGSALELTVSPLHHRYRRRSGPEAPTDLSCAESALRYGSFVVLAAFSATATLLVTPALLLHVAGSTGCGDKCFSLEDELLASIDHSVHPCDDFYR